jgi:ankyrin repeat protein
VADLFALVAAGDADAVRDLLDRRPELAGERDAEGRSLVLHALSSGRDDLVEPILDANPPLDVFDAAAVGRTRGLEELHDAEPELVNATRPDGSTPLHLAARFEQADTVEVLLERGADRAARDGEGRTPADVAAEATRELLAGGG